MPTDAKVAPESCLGAFGLLVFYITFFIKMVKNGDGALVGITWVKGTSVDIFFQVFEKMQKMVSGTCRSCVNKRYKCAEKGTEQIMYQPRFFGIILDQNRSTID